MKARIWMITGIRITIGIWMTIGIRIITGIRMKFGEIKTQ